MSKLKMPAMRYAVITVSGDIHNVATAWGYLYRATGLSTARTSSKMRRHLRYSWIKEARWIGRTLNWNYACRVRRPAERRS